MKKLCIVLVLICTFALSSCADIEQITPSIATPTPTPESPIRENQPQELDLEMLKNLLFKADSYLREHLPSEQQLTVNVIGVFEESCDLPVVEQIGDYTSFSEMCQNIDCYSPEMLRLEYRRLGYEIVSDKIGFVMASGENRYFIQDGTVTNRVSSFELIYQDELKAVVSVDCYSDTENDPEPYEYTFDITDKDNPIVIDISGYGLQSLKDTKATPVSGKTTEEYV